MKDLKVVNQKLLTNFWLAEIKSRKQYQKHFQLLEIRSSFLITDTSIDMTDQTHKMMIDRICNIHYLTWEIKTCNAGQMSDSLIDQMTTGLIDILKV